MSTSRALLIDCDGVLRHRDPEIAARCERQAGLPAGSLLATALRPDLLGPAITGEISQREWETRIVLTLAEQYPDIDATAAVRDSFGDTGYLDEDVLALVDSLRPRVTVCLISNATDRLHADLAALGLADRVDHVLSSADLGVPKPDPRFYAAAARLTGVPAKRCLVVDDSAENADAAQRSGMTGHTFTSAATLKDTIDEWLARDLVTMSAPVVERTAVRVLCLDPQDRVLLMHWRDPVTGGYLWEPPGGGVEPGESHAEAATREVAEETGMVGVDVGTVSVPVRRDYMWHGYWYRSAEEFFVARVPADQVVAEPALTESEVATLAGTRWWTWPELLASTERIEPADFVPVLRRLAPEGPWRSVASVSDPFKTDRAQ